MIVIEHDVHLMTGLCDEFVAMELGHVITRGDPAEVMAHPDVVASYLGTDSTMVTHRSGPANQAPPPQPPAGPAPRIPDPLAQHHRQRHPGP
jgi:ABC-type hemin transport system ATPase subunit